MSRGVLTCICSGDYKPDAPSNYTSAPIVDLSQQEYVFSSQAKLETFFTQDDHRSI